MQDNSTLDYREMLENISKLDAVHAAYIAGRVAQMVEDKEEK